jgi:hypothetical protein
VGEEVRELVLKGVVSEPEVRPEGHHVTFADGDFRYRPKGFEASGNVFPGEGVEVVGISQVSSPRPANIFLYGSLIGLRLRPFLMLGKKNHLVVQRKLPTALCCCGSGCAPVLVAHRDQLN